MKLFTVGDAVEVRPSAEVGWVRGKVVFADVASYVLGDMLVLGHGDLGHYMIETARHGRFSVSPGHPDLRALRW